MSSTFAATYALLFVEVINTAAHTCAVATLVHLSITRLLQLNYTSASTAHALRSELCMTVAQLCSADNKHSCAVYCTVHMIVLITGMYAEQVLYSQFNIASLI
jgi:hypothetical protein